MLVMEQKKYLTPEEIAQELHVNVETVLRWLRKKELPGYQVGRLWRINRQDYDQFLNDRYNKK